MQRNDENKIRLLILEILQKLPPNEHLKPSSLELCTMLLQIFKNDNEDNAIIALKTFFELNKAYRTHLESVCQSFSSMVLEFLKNHQEAFDQTFKGSEEGIGLLVNFIYWRNCILS